MSDENIIDVDQNETDTCEEITDTDTISGEDKSENISTNEAAGTTEDIDADYSIDEEPGESSEDTSCSEANEATTVSGATASQVAETAGSKRWNEYTSSTDLDDTDELMILDTSAKANKRTLLSKLSDYVLGKLADKVFEKLETQNKTILGALNELNSKLEITAIAPNPLDKGNKTSSYKISPKIIDQSILCVCRSEVYLITLGQRSPIFNSIFLNKVFDAVSVKDASVKLAENKKDIIFTCAFYENPIFVGRF